MWCAHKKKHNKYPKSKVEASLKQAVIDEYLGSSKMNLTISKELFEKDLVGMVVQSGLPLFHFQARHSRARLVQSRPLSVLASTLIILYNWS